MRASKAAKRYAQALLDLAIEKGSVDALNDDMSQLAVICEESKDLTNLLKSPIVDSSKKLSIIEEIFGSSMNEMSMGFIKLIIKNTRENMLDQMASAYVDLYKEHKNILDVTVVSAYKLEGTTKDKIIAKVKESHSGAIELHEEIDEALIGGFVLRMGDNQLDASIKGQLTQLNNILLN